MQYAAFCKLKGHLSHDVRCPFTRPFAVVRNRKRYALFILRNGFYFRYFIQNRKYGGILCLHILSIFLSRTDTGQCGYRFILMFSW